MIQIKFPGVKNIFFIEDQSQIKLIEQEIENTFFPYTQKVIAQEKCGESQYNIFIETDGFNVTVKTNIVGASIVQREYDSSYGAYRKAYSIIRENLQLENGFCFLHGSCVVIDDTACLFLAETGVGKSTLSVYCDVAGQICLTDDLIIMDVSSRIIYPISKYAHIRENGTVFFDQNVFSPRLSFNSFISRYEYSLSEKRFAQTFKIEYIFILNRSFPKEKIVESTNSYFKILENMFLPYQIKSNILSALNICKQYKIYDVFYSDLNVLLKKLRLFIKSTKRQ